jgi:hypothetical protein
MIDAKSLARARPRYNLRILRIQFCISSFSIEHFIQSPRKLLGYSSLASSRKGELSQRARRRGSHDPELEFRDVF